METKFANGREARIGDPVVGRDYMSGKIVTGAVVYIAAGEVGLVPVLPLATHVLPADKCLHAEDALNAGMPRQV